jgi:hypothetical protein
MLVTRAAKVLAAQSSRAAARKTLVIAGMKQNTSMPTHLNITLILEVLADPLMTPGRSLITRRSLATDQSKPNKSSNPVPKAAAPPSGTKGFNHHSKASIVTDNELTPALGSPTRSQTAKFLYRRHIAVCCSFLVCGSTCISAYHR